MTKVMTFGTFDILHPGHVYYLKKAKALGDKLIVVVARDKSIKIIKGRKPIFKDKERLLIIKALRFVDIAVLGNKIANKTDAYGIIKEYRPQIVALGHDQWPDAAALRRWLLANRLKAKVVRIGSKSSMRSYKSSKIKKLLHI